MINRIKVFISWSDKSSSSYVVAKGLKDWIQKVNHFTEPFLSSDDILVGERWNEVLNKEIDESGFGIICLTKNNLTSPWILFEAGVLSGRYNSHRRVCPLLIDIELEELKPPLSQFNCVTADKDGLFKLIESINKIPNEGQAVPDKILIDSFNVWWNEIEQVFASVTKVDKK